MLIDGDGKQSLADEIKQCAGRVDCEQYAEAPQDCERLLVQVLQIEQPHPEQFLGCGVVGDEVHGERVGGCGRFLGGSHAAIPWL